MLRHRQITPPSLFSILLFAVVVCLVIVIPATDFAHADTVKEKKIGVAVSAVINTDMDVGVDVSHALGNALEEQLQVTTVSGEDAQALLPSAARDESCLGNAQCLRSAGKALGVDELLMLIIIDIGDNYKIEATWIDVESGKTALRPAIDSPKDAALLTESMRNQARTLLPDTKPRAKPSHLETGPDDKIAKDGSKNALGGSTSSGRRWTSTSKALLIGGLISGIGWATYGGVRLATCEEDTNDKCIENGSDSTVDLLGGVGTIAFTSAALILYFTSDSGMEAPPVALGVQQDSFAFSYQGHF